MTQQVSPQLAQTTQRTVAQTNLLLIRHGQTKWNVERRCQGQIGEGLTETGREQARGAGEALREMGLEVDALYSSDLERTMETAKLVAEAAGFPDDMPVIEDARLRELAQGEWEGHLYDEIEADYLKFINDPVRYPPPGGENLLTMTLRVIESLSDIAVKHPGGNVAVVSHELPIAAVLCTLDRRPLQEWLLFAPENGAVSPLDWPPAKALNFKVTIETPLFEEPESDVSNFIRRNSNEAYRKRRREMATLRLARWRRMNAIFPNLIPRRLR